MAMKFFMRVMGIFTEFKLSRILYEVYFERHFPLHYFPLPQLPQLLYSVQLYSVCMVEDNMSISINHFQPILSGNYKHLKVN